MRSRRPALLDMKRLTGKQQRRLAALVDDPDQLDRGDVDRFFAFTDRGDRTVLRTAGSDFFTLVHSHEHGIESDSWKRDTIRDFKSGLLFLVEFDYARTAVQVAACSCYLTYVGFATPHLRAWRELWGLPNDEPPSMEAMEFALKQRATRRPGGTNAR